MTFYFFFLKINIPSYLLKMGETNSNSGNDEFNLILSKSTSIFNDRSVTTDFDDLFSSGRIQYAISYFSLYVIIYQITVLIYLYFFLYMG